MYRAANFRTVRAKTVFAEAIVAERVVVDSEEVVPGGGGGGAGDLADGAVTTAKIANGAVTLRKLAADVLHVGTSRLENESVTTDKLRVGCVTKNKLAEETFAVGEDRIVTGAVTTSKLARNAVGNDALGERAVEGVNLAFQSVETDHITNEAILREKLKDGCVDSTKLAIDAVESAIIKDDAVTAAKVAPAAIGVDHVRFSSADGLTQREHFVAVKEGISYDALVTDTVIATIDLENGIPEIIVLDMCVMITSFVEAAYSLSGSFRARVTIDTGQLAGAVVLGKTISDKHLSGLNGATDIDIIFRLPVVLDNSHLEVDVRLITAAEPVDRTFRCSVVGTLDRVKHV